MNTFETALSPDSYTEILQGGKFVAFDLVAETAVFVVFSETDTTPVPATEGNKVQSWAEDWDFEASGFALGQRIWVKGNNTIRGVRE